MSNSNLCPECGENSVIADEVRGIIVCEECGFVVFEKIINSGAEWRAYTSEEVINRVRTGIPSKLSYYDKGLNTVIGNDDKDGNGNALSPQKKAEINRLRKQNKRTMRYKSEDRRLAKAMSELDRLSSQLNLSDELKQSAAYIFRKISHLVKGRSSEIVMMASLFAACKLNLVPKTLDEIVKYSMTIKKRVSKTYSLILNELNMKIKATSPINYLPQLCNKLNITAETQKKAIKILIEARRYLSYAGKTPIGLAGAALYIVCLANGERRSQREISEATGVSEATIRNRYKELLNYYSLKGDGFVIHQGSLI